MPPVTDAATMLVEFSRQAHRENFDHRMHDAAEAIVHFSQQSVGSQQQAGVAAQQPVHAVNVQPTDGSTATNDGSNANTNTTQPEESGKGAGNDPAGGDGGNEAD
jgi:hypothetical protein